jgi:hypothetical protein
MYVKRRSHSEVRTSVKIQKGKFSFGIPHYKCVIPNIFDPANKLAKLSKSKNNNFTDIYAKGKEYLPSPDKYEVRDTWVKKNMSLQFSKVPRTTFSESIMKESPKTPGPGQYNPSRIITKNGGLNSTTIRHLGFINEAICKGENNIH